MESMRHAIDCFECDLRDYTTATANLAFVDAEPDSDWNLLGHLNEKNEIHMGIFFSIQML